MMRQNAAADRRAALVALVSAIGFILGFTPGVKAAAKPFVVTIKASSTSIKPLSSVTLTGTVNPAAPGKKVNVQQKSGSTWKTVTTAVLTKTSTYSATLRLDAPARSVAYRVAMPAVGSSAAGNSPTTTVKIVYSGPPMRQVDLGGTVVCGVTTASAAICWGNDGRGQLGDSVESEGPGPVAVHGLQSDVKEVAVGGDFACALTSAGAVSCWGANEVGQVGFGRRNQPLIDVPVPVTGLGQGVKAISAGARGACALTTGGAVLCWGTYPGDGRPRIESWPYSDVPVQVPGLESGVRSIAVGTEFSCAVLAAGELRCWGAQGDVVGALQETPSAPTIPSGHVYASVVAGTGNVCAITTTGGADCWGSSFYGQVGDGSANYGVVPAPTPTAGLQSKPASLTLGGGHTCAIIASKLHCWGAGSRGQLGTGKKVNVAAPAAVPGFETGVRSVSAGSESTCVISNGGALICFGSGEQGRLGNGSMSDSVKPVTMSAVRPPPVENPSRKDFVAVGVGRHHGCGLTQAGGVWCWGSNEEGQFGDGGVAPSDGLVQPRGLSSGVVAIAAGFFYTCALNDDGLVRCWGRDGFGQLGQGRIQGVLVPTVVKGLTDVASVSVSGIGGVTCAVTRSGGAFCWGDNADGQLGIGGNPSERPYATTPQPVYGLSSGVRSISTGNGSVCAVTTSDAVFCWGGNRYGQLGTGVAGYGLNSSVPVAVPGLESGVRDVSVGYDHACAVLTSGGVTCWGRNDQAQISGSGDSASPRTVEGVPEVVAINSATETTCVVTNAGGALCWGKEPLGDGLSGSGGTPRPVRGLDSGVRTVVAGELTRCALLSRGVIQCWNYVSRVPRTL